MNPSILQAAHEEMEAILEVVKRARQVEQARWIGHRDLESAVAVLAGALADLDEVRSRPLRSKT